MLSRAHTTAVVALIALVPLTPLALWAYARAASVERGPAVAANERVFRSVPHVPGVQRFAAHSYPMYRWGVEGALVPIVAYRTEFFLRLPRALPPRTIVAHYVRVLPGWRATVSRRSASFARGAVSLYVDTGETGDAGRPTRSFAVYVSQ